MHQIKVTRGSSDAIMHEITSPSAQVALVTQAPTAATSCKNGNLKFPLGVGFIHILVFANPRATRLLRRKVSRLCRLRALFQFLAPPCCTRDEAPTPIAYLYDDDVEENPNEILLFPIYDDVQISARAPADNHSNAIYTSTVARCSYEANIHLKEYTPSRHNCAYNVKSSSGSDGRFPLKVLSVRVAGDSSPEKIIFDKLTDDDNVDHTWNCALPENLPELVPPSPNWNLPLLEVSIKDSDAKHSTHPTALVQDQIDQGNEQTAEILSRGARPSDPLAGVYQEEVLREGNSQTGNGTVKQQSSIPLYNQDMNVSKMNAEDISPPKSSSFHSDSEDFIPLKGDDVELWNHAPEKSTSIFNTNDDVKMTSSAEPNSSSSSSKDKGISQEEDPWKLAFERAEIYDKKYSNGWHDSDRPQGKDKGASLSSSGRKNKILSLSTINEK